MRHPYFSASNPRRILKRRIQLRRYPFVRAVRLSAKTREHPMPQIVQVLCQSIATSREMLQMRMYFYNRYAIAWPIPGVQNGKLEYRGGNRIVAIVLTKRKSRKNITLSEILAF
jgi:hypothetical protein